jgi:anterior pharynx defective protein 1
MVDFFRLGHIYHHVSLLLLIVGGLGFGLISGIVTLANVIQAATGPGAVGIKGDSEYFVLFMCLGTLVMTFLHVNWGVLFFAGWEKRNWLLIILVPVSHMFVSSLSIINDKISPVYFLPPAYCILFILSAISLFVAGARPQTLLNFFKIK